MFKKIFRAFTLLFIVLSCFSSCKAKKKAVTSHRKPRIEKVVKKSPEPKRHTEFIPTVINNPPVNSSYTELVDRYISNYSGIAMEEMLQYGIPSSITLAQGILESGAGIGELTLKANNHFGIKCHTDWNGDTVYHDDDENQECFRKYTDPKYSFRDHSLFLTERSRYQELFKLKKDDYEAWAKGLRKAGYATDPKYPDKLIGIIERFDLAKYDAQVLGKNPRVAAVDKSKIETYKVEKGDTLYAISKRFNIPLETLKEYNGLSGNEISIGQLLYLHQIKN